MFALQKRQLGEDTQRRSCLPIQETEQIHEGNNRHYLPIELVPDGGLFSFGPCNLFIAAAR